MPSIVELETRQFAIAEKEKGEDFKSWLLPVALYSSTLFIIKSNLHLWSKIMMKNDFKRETPFF